MLQANKQDRKPVLPDIEEEQRGMTVTATILQKYIAM